ncbi:hypothetical protein HX116_12030 [Acinetobacter towneri]|uniref:crAss001_48 related protein n=1 Tax=Acinetobacter towneri TaxID=202956 RepID=UPI0025756064|nr:hypothetical protein [Acinetobacter towneri]MDM1734525.1 hypothetical protein [Acinetobacter towneri]
MSKKLLALSMTVFAGASLVHAATMTRQEYNDYRGWQLPEGENGNDVGYIIEDRAGKKNTEELDGFVQWLPKDEFLRKFSPAETPQDRVRLEQRELYTKLDALENFLDKGQPSFINDEQWEQLNFQSKAMHTYNQILLNRLELFKEEV